jgi:UDP-N-acetylmuramyl pentapeptide synthase
VLGDMLELGEHSRDLHTKSSPDAMQAAEIDRLYLAGPEIKVLADRPCRTTSYCDYEETADGLTEKLLATPHARRRVHDQVVQRNRVFAHRARHFWTSIRAATR